MKRITEVRGKYARSLGFLAFKRRGESSKRKKKLLALCVERIYNILDARLLPEARANERSSSGESRR